MLQNNRAAEFENPRITFGPASLRLPRPTNHDFGLECGGKILPAIHKNEDIIVAGNGHTSLYINHDGWLFQYKILHNGSRQIVDFILPGEIFGLQACLFITSLYSVVAITDATVSAIPFEVVAGAFERNPKLSKALFWSAVCESAILGEHLVDAGRRSAYERVSHLLLELFVRLRRSGQTDGLSFHMPLTQELIGDSLGLTTVHVNRTLRSIREDGLIAIKGKQVTLLDCEAMCRLCDFQKSYLGEHSRALQM
jgi:CRP-like cAMP-binding protein